MQTPPREVTQWLHARAARDLELASSGPSRREFLPHCPVSGFGLVRSIKRQPPPVSAARMGSDPGIFVRKTPGLNRGAARTVQARSYDAAIDIALPAQVLSPRQTGGIEWQGNV